MSAYTAEQINAAMTAPVEMVTGPRTAKLIAKARIAAPIAAAEAAKERKHRMAAEKREEREQRKLDRIAKKAQKADKANKRKTKVVKPMTVVANAAAKSSIKTVNANKISDGPTHARIENIKLVEAIIIPETNMALSKPIRIANRPPNNVNIIVVIQPIPFEYKAISIFENPISL